MPTPAEIPCSSTDPDEQSSTAEREQFDEHQLKLQFFAVLDGYSRNPPERVYWRDAVKLRLKHALGTAALWVVHMRRVTPRTVHHVALAIYYYANGAGMIQVPQATMAEDCEIDTKTFSRAIIVLKRLGLLRAFRTNRRAPETLAMNIGGLTWTAARQQARERRRLAQASNFELAFDPSSGGRTPPLGGSSGGRTPPPWAVRTGGTYTTTTRVRSTRPPATDTQIAYAVDLGINPDGKDLVQLGEEIEMARTKRAELRTAARKKSTPVPGTHNGRRRLMPIEQQRIREARRMASPRPEKPLPAQETAAEATDRLHRGLTNAETHGYRRDPNDPDVLVGPSGRRVWCGALAQLDGRIPAEERP